jgi:hypothetical protein
MDLINHHHGVFPLAVPLEASRSGAFERLRHRCSYSGFVNNPKGYLSQPRQGRHVCSNAHALKNNAPCKGAMCDQTRHATWNGAVYGRAPHPDAAPNGAGLGVSP